MDNVCTTYATILLDCFAPIINFNSHLYFQAQQVAAGVAPMQPDIQLVLPRPIHDLISMGALNVRILMKNKAALDMVNSQFLD
jgi:hypothetical protein